MSSINDKDLKTRGISAIMEVLASSTQATVSVHGEDRFVLTTMARRCYLRECELIVARAESERDMTAGRFVKESVDAHMKRLDNLL